MDKYMDLLEMSYIDAVNVLLKRYGPATDDYFNEVSYERLLNGDIKSVTKKKQFQELPKDCIVSTSMKINKKIRLKHHI